MVHSPRHRRILNNRKGYATLLATIIMVMIVMFLFYNVYLFKLGRDADYQNAISRSQQLDADQTSEVLTLLAFNSSLGGNNVVIISGTLINNGQVPIQIVRLWLQDISLPAPNVANVTLNVVLQPGARIFRSFQVFLSGTSSWHSFFVRFVTSRGNAVPASIN
jgi:hypothetical protein